MENSEIYLALFVAFLIVAAVMITFFSNQKQIILKKEAIGDHWDFGDEWKNIPQELDLKDWEEVITVTQGFSRLYDKGIPALKREVLDLNRIQNILLEEHQIASHILPAKESISPADSLFVEKENVEKAKEILKQLSLTD